MFHAEEASAELARLLAQVRSVYYITGGSRPPKPPRGFDAWCDTVRDRVRALDVVSGAAFVRVCLVACDCALLRADSWSKSATEATTHPLPGK